MVADKYNNFSASVICCGALPQTRKDYLLYYLFWSMVEEILPQVANCETAEGNSGIFF